MISYLIKSGLCLAILLAFYHMVLEREKMHQFNRFYLLGSVLFSFLVPFTFIYVEAEPKVIIDNLTVNYSSASEITEIASSQSLVWTDYLLILYTFVSTILLIRFVKNFVDILGTIRKNTTLSYNKAKLVLVDDSILPHTFWNYIFINKDEYESKKVERELFTHELAHVTQRHTIDVLIVEILQIVLWFNPFFYPLKKAIQLNHEFLADDNVIASHNDIPKYQYLLLDKAAWKNKYYLASNLNYSLTKKRLLMMKTPNSKSTLLWKKLAIVPLMGGLFFLFADRVEAQTKKKKPVIKEVVLNSEATPAQMEKYRYLLKTSEESKQFKMKDIEQMVYIYNLMSSAQKKTVKDVREIVPPPPPPIKRKDLPEGKFRDYKDGSKYAVWIDGVSVDNKKLNAFNASDFVSYTESSVKKNARSKRFPQANQVSLYTEKYFEQLAYQERRILREVKVKEKKLPPPPPKIAKKVIEKSPPPPPKPIKIEVVKKKNKNKKGELIDIVEEIEEPVIEVREVIRETPEEEEKEVEVIEIIKEEKVETIELLEKEHEKHEIHKEMHEKEHEHEEAHEDHLKETYKEMVQQKAKFYLNGKKISAKKIKKYFFDKKDKVKTIDVIKKKDKFTVKLKTK